MQATELQREVSALYKGRTAIKVTDLLEPYKGRSIEVNGKVSQVQMSSPTEYYVILQGTPDGTARVYLLLQNRVGRKTA